MVEKSGIKSDNNLMKKIFPVCLFVAGALGIFYDILLLILSPGTFWDIVFSFTHIWSALGLFFIFCGIFRLKKGYPFYKNWKKKTKIFWLSFLGIVFLISVINLIIILTPKTVSLEDDADYLLLLGGGIDKDGKLPPPVVQRVNKAAEYLLCHPQTKVVVTGGTLFFSLYPEAPAIKNELIKNGIQSDRIFLEDKALDTIQNFQFSCQLLSEVENCSKSEILNSQVVVVSSRYHLSRAQRIARRLGYTNVKGIGCKTPAVYVPFSYVREICAHVKLNARIFFTRKPGKIKD